MNDEADAMFARVKFLRSLAASCRAECNRLDELSDAERREACRIEEEAAEIWDKAYALKYPKDGLLGGLRRI